ncbi:hypothetical protein SCWH03_04490 [Streptomyces pacificus]|uniref:Uncharacterized protein n=1 Tax=Streptomyces pacificus TaxID=2705029 RepID=A0A6A0AMS4_9ACTN|nr:hypothetical protein SCWH03_04490 [Streptomyces pacificus]
MTYWGRRTGCLWFDVGKATVRPGPVVSDRPSRAPYAPSIHPPGRLGGRHTREIPRRAVTDAVAPDSGDHCGTHRGLRIRASVPDVRAAAREVCSSVPRRGPWGPVASGHGSGRAPRARRLRNKSPSEHGA